MSTNPNHNFAPAIREEFRNNLVSWCVAPPETISNEWIQGYRYAIALMEDLNYHTGAEVLEEWLLFGTGVTIVTDSKLEKECAEIYQASGQSGVFNHIQQNYPKTNWAWCDPCESESPTTSTNSCLVCGSPTRTEQNDN